MRRNPKTDRNQPEIVAALRAAGCSVQILSAVGQGVPDLLVGYNPYPYHERYTLLMEIKDGLARKQDRKLTPDQVAWHFAWKGQHVHVVESVEQAMSLLKMYQ